MNSFFTFPRLKRWPSHERFLRIMSGEARDPRAHAWRIALASARPGYRGLLALDRTQKRFRAKSLGRPTLSVGNLTTGGTGKTPMTVELVRRLIEQGHRPAVLLRGYGTSDLEAKRNSDEVEVLRQALGTDVPVEPHPSRVKSARQVLQRTPETTCFVLDDGFQHRRALRDLDLVLIDATRPFGFERLLPRGLLREPISALKRASALILTRTDQVTPEALDALTARLTDITGVAPIAHARHAWTTLRLGHKTLPLETLEGLNVYGVCGIGNPDTFERQLRDAAHRVVGFSAFDDHHKYGRGEIMSVFNAALERGGTAVVTTDKDWVKWRKTANRIKLRLPVYRPGVTMTFSHGSENLDALLHAKLPLPYSEDDR
ncbi:MAG: tetraacyldisaccharide 4'-kinase [Planctomycetota bacterium]